MAASPGPFIARGSDWHLTVSGRLLAGKGSRDKQASALRLGLPQGTSGQCHEFKAAYGLSPPPKGPRKNNFSATGVAQSLTLPRPDESGRALEHAQQASR